MAGEDRVFPLRVAGLTVLALLLAACETLRVGSDYDRSADFSRYHTFTLMPRHHEDVSNPLVVQRVEDDIKADLTRRGYQYVSDPSQADFAVDFTIGSKERTDIHSYPAPWGGPWAWGPRGWYGSPGWWGDPYWGNTIDVRQYREGTLSIDVFDDRSHRPVWHGWAKKTLTRADIEHSEAPLRQAVAQVLSRFPPQAGSS